MTRRARSAQRASTLGLRKLSRLRPLLAGGCELGVMANFQHPRLSTDMEQPIQKKLRLPPFIVANVGRSPIDEFRQPLLSIEMSSTGYRADSRASVIDPHLKVHTSPISCDAPIPEGLPHLTHLPGQLATTGGSNPEQDGRQPGRASRACHRCPGKSERGFRPDAQPARRHRHPGFAAVGPRER